MLVSQLGSIRVSGTLLAAGQPDASIELGSLLDSAECQRWGGVVVVPSSRGVLLQYVWLTGATTALTVNRPGSGVGDSPVVVDKCAFDDWQESAVVYQGTDSVIIRQSTFGLGQGGGQAAIMRSSVVVGNGGDGAVIEHCVFNGFRGDVEGTQQPNIATVVIDQGQPVLRSNTFLRDATTCNDGSLALRINEIVVRFRVPPRFV